MSFEYDLHKAIYDALQETDDTSLSADFTTQTYRLVTANFANAISYLRENVVDIYDNVPQANDSGAASAFPYIVAGDISHNNWSTDSERGTDATVTIHSWSRYRGYKEIEQIQGAVYDVLDRATLTVENYSFVTCDYVDSTRFVDADGFTRHGVQTFRVLLDEA